MTARPNKIFRFWNEVKRRHVHRSLAVYAGSAFIFLEAATIIFPRWGLPDWSIDLVLYLLILGALATVAIAWIFDLTPEGVQKTPPLEEAVNVRKTGDSTAWRIATYLSLIVIVALIIVNIVPLTKNSGRASIESLVFLPFDNYTGDEDLEFLVSGIHSSLITDMQKVSALRVLGNSTANSLKGTNLSLPQIASKLSIEAAVEGSISCVGNDSICVQVRLIGAYPEKQLWVEDFRIAKAEILNFYNEVTKKISAKINVALSPEEENLLADSRIVDPDAYDAYLMGQFYWEKLDPESMQKALEYFQLAIDLDPEWADPYAGLANSWVVFGMFNYLPKNITVPKTYQYLNRALELDPNSAQAHFVKAIITVWSEYDWEKGEKEFLQSLELNPNEALCRMYYAHLLMILRKENEALEQANKALELDPLKPLVLGLYAVVMKMEGEYDSAIKHYEKALEIDPQNMFAAGNLRAIRIQVIYDSGDYEKWFKWWGEKVRGNWNEIGRTAVLDAFHEKGHIAGIEEMFKMNEKFGNDNEKGGCLMTEGVKFERYLYLGDYDKVLDFMETLYESGEMEAAYFATNDYYPHLKDNPRYIALLKKMKL